VSTGKISASEPLMTHRKSLKEAVKTEGDKFSQEKPEGDLLTVQTADGRRCKGGMSPVQASLWNVGTWPLMRREMTSGQPSRGRIPMQRSRGGATRSSVEAIVMVVERRGGVILLVSSVKR
jgi:hypothetical protein